MSVRIYVPGTLAGLRDWLAAGVVPIGEQAHTAAEETEVAEYVALMAAADVSAELVADAPTGQRRRVVVVGEAASADGSLPFNRVVAVHVDTEDDADPDDDLAWFATQELDDLVTGI